MAKKVMIAIMTLALMTVFCTAISAQEKAEGKAEKKEKAAHDYIGVKKCKMCHKKDGTHSSWLETKHAAAFEVLDEEARKKEECVVCHTTGTTAKGALLEGVQCEACHGAGADYYKKSIMKDLEKAMANGLILPDSTVCMKCHNENVPDEFRPKEGYNFVEMMKTGVHAIPEKTK